MTTSNIQLQLGQQSGGGQIPLDEVQAGAPGLIQAFPKVIDFLNIDGDKGVIVPGVAGMIFVPVAMLSVMADDAGSFSTGIPAVTFGTNSPGFDNVGAGALIDDPHWLKNAAYNQGFGPFSFDIPPASVGADVNVVLVVPSSNTVSGKVILLGYYMAVFP